MHQRHPIWWPNGRARSGLLNKGRQEYLLDRPGPCRRPPCPASRRGAGTRAGRPRRACSCLECDRSCTRFLSRTWNLVCWLFELLFGEVLRDPRYQVLEHRSPASSRGRTGLSGAMSFEDEHHGADDLQVALHHPAVGKGQSGEQELDAQHAAHLREPLLVVAVVREVLHQLHEKRQPVAPLAIAEDDLGGIPHGRDRGLGGLALVDEVGRERLADRVGKDAAVNKQRPLLRT